MTSPLMGPHCNVERQRPTKTASCEKKHHGREHMSA